MICTVALEIVPSLDPTSPKAKPDPRNGLNHGSSNAPSLIQAITSLLIPDIAQGNDPEMAYSFRPDIIREKIPAMTSPMTSSVHRTEGDCETRGSKQA